MFVRPNLFSKLIKSRRRFAGVHKTGLTLVELLVVITIVIIMTSVILANLPAFRSKTELDLVAQEMAVTIRQSQVYGAVARAGGQYPAYGIYLDPGNDPMGFVFFAEKCPPNNKYDKGLSSCTIDEIIEQFAFKGGVSLAKMECKDSSGWHDVYNPGAGVSDPLTLVFKRPSYEANYYSGAGSSLTACGAVSHVRITIAKDGPVDPSNPESNKRYIVVWNTGHIYATKTLAQTE